MSAVEITRQQSAIVDELVGLADEKGALFWKAFGMLMRGCFLALTGKASDAVQMIYLRARRIAVNWSNSLVAVVVIAFGGSPCRAWPTR